MSKLADFTDEFLLQTYPTIATTEDIEIIDSDDFTCLTFQTVADHEQSDDDETDEFDNWSDTTTTSRKSMGHALTRNQPDVRCNSILARRGTTGTLDSILMNFRKPQPLRRVTDCVDNLASVNSARTRVKNFLTHNRFFDKITGILLGESKSEAVARSAKFGIENFVRGDLAEARRFFNSAYKNSEVNSDEERQRKELLDITKTVIEAEEDIARRKFNNCVINMQNAYIECKNEDMKRAVSERRNAQAERFGEMGETFVSEGNRKVGGEFFKLAYNMCTPEHARKDEFKAKVNEMK
jgi:hypothetical protein